MPTGTSGYNKKSSSRCFFCGQVSPISPTLSRLHGTYPSILLYPVHKQLPCTANTQFQSLLMPCSLLPLRHPGANKWSAGKNDFEAVFWRASVPHFTCSVLLAHDVPLQTNNKSTTNMPKYRPLRNKSSYNNIKITYPYRYPSRKTKHTLNKFSQ